MEKQKIVGLISIMTPDQTWPQSTKDRITGTHRRLSGILEGMGFTVIASGELARDYREIQEAGRVLAAKGVQALILYVGAWSYANCAIAFTQNLRVPIIMWVDAEPGSRGLVGGAIVRGALAEIGEHAHFIYDSLDSFDAQTRCRKLLEGICAARSLRGQVMGLGGGRTMGMVTATVDPIQVLLTFGVDIDSFDQMEVVRRAKQQDPARVEHFLQWMKSRFGCVIPPDVVMARQVRLYLALQELCLENHYDFVTLRCLPEMAAEYTTYCLAHAIMGDAQDDLGNKRRFVLSCESDINAALTMQLLHLLQDGPVMFTDLSQFDFVNNVLVVLNCGSHPTDFAIDPRDVIWEREGVHNIEWKFGGSCPQTVARAGTVTMARLYREDGVYRMMIAAGTTVYFPREKLHETVWERPHAFIRLAGDRQSFFDAIRSNHIHIVFGDWQVQLVEACRVLGIEAVLAGV